MDERPVRADRIRKSIGSETTFPDDLHAIDAMLTELRPLAAKVWTHCQGAGTRARTVTLKVKYANFQQITRSRSFMDGIPDQAALERTASELLASIFPIRLGVRLLGITLSALDMEDLPAAQQLTLTF